jgi:hypothetical protein
MFQIQCHSQSSMLVQGQLFALHWPRKVTPRAANPPPDPIFVTTCRTAAAPQGVVGHGVGVKFVMPGPIVSHPCPSSPHMSGPPHIDVSAAIPAYCYTQSLSPSLPPSLSPSLRPVEGRWPSGQNPIGFEYSCSCVEFCKGGRDGCRRRSPTNQHWEYGLLACEGPTRKQCERSFCMATPWRREECKQRRGRAFGATG